MSFTKTFTFLIFALALVVSTFGMVSAAPICSGTVCFNAVNAPSSATAGTTISVPFNVTYEGTASSTTLNFASSTTNIGTLTMPSGVTINMNETKALTASLSIPAGSTGTINMVFNVSTGTGGNAVFTVSPITITQANPTNFCSNGPQGNATKMLELTIDDISNSGEGDDTEWQPLDTIEVEVNVENIGTDDIDDVIVELGLFRNGKNEINDVDFFSSDEEEVEVGDLDNGDDEDITFEFQLPADFEKGDYVIRAKAYEDGKQTTLCGQATDENIDVVNADDVRSVVVSEIVLPNEVTCGDTVLGTFKIFNIGGDDQDQVLVRITNRDLGIAQTVEFKEDLNEGDNELLDFSFVVPRGLSDRAYPISFTTEYDYRNGNYREQSENTWTSNLNVIGCSGSPTTPGNTNAQVSATLDSDAVAGKEMVVSAVIRNTGSETQSYIIDAQGYESWSELTDISDRIVTLEPGKIKAITLTFLVDKDATGSNTFDITTTSNGATSSQEVEVSVSGSQSSFNLSGNGLIWVIGAVNLILVLLIIFVAIKLSRR